MQVVRAAAAGIITATESGLQALCTACEDKEPAVCTAAIARLQQIAPRLRQLQPEHAAAILALARDTSIQGRGTAGTGIASVHCTLPD